MRLGATESSFAVHVPHTAATPTLHARRESAFDELARFAAQNCAAPVAVIALVDGWRLLFKGQYGVEQTADDPSLARWLHAIRQRAPLVVPDALCDARFDTSWSESRGTGYRFYAGAPLLDGEGAFLGTLAVLDRSPRPFTAQQADALQIISRQVMAQLELRRAKLELRRAEEVALRERREHERNEERLVRERNLSESTINSVPGVFYIFNAQGRFLRWNDNFEKVTGYSHAEFAQLHPLELFRGSDKDLVAERIGDVFLAGTAEADVKLVTKDERALDYFFTGRLVEVDGEPCLIGVGVDVTARKQLESHLRRVQRAESIGQLAAGLAHDFNNILLIILGQTSSLLGERLLSERGGEAVEQIGLAADRAARLTGQLLMLSRKQVMQVQALDINEVLLRMMPLLQRLVGEAVSLELDLAESLPSVAADVGMIEQVVLNLIINARDATARGGCVVIRSETAEITAEYVAQHPGGQRGTFVTLSVIDSGVGISPTHLPHIFEPFYTTKEVGKGTGLGLATVESILKQHQGWVEVTSELDIGTTFRLHLPATRLPANALVDAISGPDVANRGTEMILIVEDEARVAATLETTIQSYGYRTMLASDGPRALELWAAANDQIDLLLTDLVMPGGMTGRELTHRLWADKPELRVIYMSGYTAEAIRGDLSEYEQLRYLQKPYRPEQLARLIRESLDRRHQGAAQR